MSETLPEPRNGAGPTESDEEEVLRSLYGEPDEHGIYRGAPADEPGGDQ